MTALKVFLDAAADTLVVDNDGHTARDNAVKHFFTKQENLLLTQKRKNCSHRCVSLKESPLKPVLILKHEARTSMEQTSVRAKWF